MLVGPVPSPGVFFNSLLGSTCGRGAARLAGLAKSQDNIMVQAAVTKLEFRKAEALFARAAAGGCERINNVSVEGGALAESSFGFWSPELIRSALSPPRAVRPNPCPRPAVEGRRASLP
jgi:hypothetical protein